MAVTKEILLRGPEEQAAYERARELAEYKGVPIGTVLAKAVGVMDRVELAQKRRADLLQQQRDDVRSRRRGM